MAESNFRKRNFSINDLAFCRFTAEEIRCRGDNIYTKVAGRAEGSYDSQLHWDVKKAWAINQTCSTDVLLAVKSIDWILGGASSSCLFKIVRWKMSNLFCTCQRLAFAQDYYDELLASLRLRIKFH